MITKTQINVLTLGGVAIGIGEYLLNSEQKVTTDKPGKDVGYAFFDGQTLTLHNYKYFGSGIVEEDTSIGLFIPGGVLTIRMEGDSAITVDAVTKSIGLCAAKDAKVTILGKGSLTILAQNGENGNVGIGGEGSVTIKSGTLRVGAAPSAYTVVNKKKVYAGESYAVNIAEFIDKGARITGNDKRGNQVNQNNSTQVVYDFKRQVPILFICLSAVTVIAVCITIWALFFRSPVVLTPTYAPVDEDPYAEEMPNQNEEDKLTSPNGGGAIGVTYSIDVAIDKTTGMATLYFANPSRSVQDMVLQLIIQDEILAQSGTLKPGKQVKQLALLDGATSKLAVGGYDGIVRVLAYDPDTGEKAIMNTDIKVHITVK